MYFRANHAQLTHLGLGNLGNHGNGRKPLSLELLMHWLGHLGLSNMTSWSLKLLLQGTMATTTHTTKYLLRTALHCS